MKMRLFTPWLIAGAYLVVALLLCVPLLKNDHLVGADYRGGLPLWATWWVPHALTHNYDLVNNSYALYPMETNWLSALSLPTSLFYAGLRPVFGWLLGYNLLIPLYLTLNALTGFYFLKYLFPHFRERSGEEMMVFLGGLALAFNPLTLEIVKSGEVSLLGFWTLLLWLLLFEYFLQAPSFKRAIGLGVALYLVVLMSIQFWNLIITVLLSYALYRAYPRRRELLDYGLITGMIFLLGCLIYPFSPYLWSTHNIYHYAPGTLQTVFSTRYQPLEVWQLYGDLNGYTLYFVVGIAALFAALWTEFTPQRRLWAAILGLNLYFYLQPDSGILTLLSQVMGADYSPRLTNSPIYLFPVMLAASVLIWQAVLSEHIGFSRHQRIYRLSFVVISIPVLILLSGWLTQLPTTAIPTRPIDQTMQADPEDYVVIEVPVAYDALSPETEASFDTLAGRSMIYAVQHGKRVTGGLVPFMSTLKTTSPLLQIARFQPMEGTVQQLRHEVKTWRVGYVLIHQGIVPPEFTDGLVGWLTWTNTFCKVGLENDLEIWRSRWHPAGCSLYTIHLGLSDGLLAAQEGWYAPEYWDIGAVRWAGQNATLQLWADTQDYELLFRAAAPQEMESQAVEVWVNGESLGTVQLQTEWGEYSLDLPRHTITEGGMIMLEFRHAQTVAIEGRDLAAVYDYVTLK